MLAACTRMRAPAPHRRCSRGADARGSTRECGLRNVAVCGVSCMVARAKRDAGMGDTSFFAH